MIRPLIALIALSLGTAAGRAEGPDLAAIDQEVRQALKTWEVPGVAVVIVRPDRVVLLKGYGERELRRGPAITPDTIFPLASCTKAFTSTALAMLADEKKVGWDDAVRDHCRDFHLSDPAADSLVSIRDLLGHRTGVGGNDLLWYRAPWSQDEMIRRVGKLPLDGPFRGTFAYQTIMYVVAGKVVTRHHPAGWDAFLRERLFRPLGMTATCTTSTEAAKRSDLARGHRRDREGRIAAIDGYPMPEPNSAGSIHTSARDLGKWLQFQLGDGSWRGRRLVSADNLAETHRPQNIIPGGDLTRAMNPETVQLTYAMGWVVQDYRGVKMIAHAGLIDGFRCQLTLLPDQQYAIGLLNNLHATRMNLALTNRLIDLLLEFPERDWHAQFGALEHAEVLAAETARKAREQRKAKGQKPTLPLPAYAGQYAHPAYGTATVKQDGGRLTWEWSSFKRELMLYDGNTFELRDVVQDAIDATFKVSGGRVESMTCFGVTFVAEKK